jgi:hypothetical protein
MIRIGPVFFSAKRKWHILFVIIFLFFGLVLFVSKAYALYPYYLSKWRTYDQDRVYIQWNGSVSYVNLYHKDNTYLPDEEGGGSCSRGCTENVTRIQNGGSISGNFTFLKSFSVQAAYSGKSGVGRIIVKACGQTIVNQNLYLSGSGTPGFNNFPAGDWNVPTSGDCTWSISASGGYVDVRAITIGRRTSPAPTVNLKINNSDGPVSLIPPGSYTLSWTSANAGSCIASGSWNDQQATSGTLAFTNVPAGTYTYTLTCTNASGTAIDSVSANVYGLPTVDVKINGQNGPLAFDEPASFNITWSSTNASSCQAEENLPGPVGRSGSKSISGLPQGNYAYTVRCSNPMGAQAVDTVNVRINSSLPTVDLKIDNQDGPITLDSPASYTLTWNSQNATTCASSSTDDSWTGYIPASGTKALSGIEVGSRTYTVTCMNVSGSTTDSATAVVIAPLNGSISALYAKLLLFGPALGQPAQTLTGVVTGGEPPYQITVHVRSPFGVETTFSKTGSNWSLDPASSGDPNLGVTEKGTWTAWVTLRDSAGGTYTTSSVIWEVSWYPVHGRP